MKTYEEWKHCITVLCGIPLTSAYVKERLVALRNPADDKTEKFRQFWGEPHLERVIDCFEQAERELQ